MDACWTIPLEMIKREFTILQLFCVQQAVRKAELN